MSDLFFFLSTYIRFHIYIRSFTMTLYQAGLAGQPGWNDCLVLDSKKRSASGGKSRARKVSAKIPPPTATSSGMDSSESLPMAMNNQVSLVDEKSETIGDINLDQIFTQLNEVCELDTSLPSREANHYKMKLEKILPTIEQEHYLVIFNSLESREKEELVNYSLLHNGVSSWVLPLRKIIESIK